MADNAISGINPYLMSANSALMNDPYFLAAYKSPNYYQLAAAQTQQGQIAGQTTTTATAAPQQQVIQPQIAEKSSHKGLAAGLILAAGATALCIAAHGKGNKQLDLIPRIGDGLQNMWKSVTKTVGEKLGKTAETFQVAEKNGKKVCQIPGKVNNLHGKDLAQDLEKIGERVDVKPLLNEGSTGFASGSKLRRFEFTHNGIDITVVDGKPVKMVKDGKNVLAQYTKPVQNADLAIKQEIDGIIEKVSKCTDIESLGLRKMYYQNIDNGVKRFYELEYLGANPELRCVRTKDFAIDSKTVNALRARNPKVDEFVTAYEKGELKISDLCGGKLSTDIGTFVVKQNGEIVEIITKDNKHLKAGTEDFLDLKYKNKEIFENVPKNYADFIERAYAMAA